MTVGDKERMMAAIFIIIALIVGGEFVSAWFLMITMGNLHAVMPIVPAVGIIEAASISIPLTIFLALIGSMQMSK